MATSEEYIKYVCERTDRFGLVRYRKMFGEYMLYIDDKPVFTVCDNTVFVKKLKDIESIMSASGRGFPYDGAKEAYIVDIENDKLLKILSPYCLTLFLFRSRKKVIIKLRRRFLSSPSFCTNVRLVFLHLFIKNR